MTKKELLKALESFNDDDVVIICDSIEGWCNIKKVQQSGSQIAIFMDEDPLFGDSD